MEAGLVELHLVSDTLISLAYFSIPVRLAYLIRKRRDLPVIKAAVSSLALADFLYCKT
jgi:hypothetical protein